MTELEKLKAASDVLGVWYGLPAENKQDLGRWINAEIARLEDPHAEAKRILKELESTGYGHLHKALVPYVRHLESELAYYKTQYQHAKEAAKRLPEPFCPIQIKTAEGWRDAASEPLNPKRVLATAAKILKEKNSKDCVTYIALMSCNARPYEVQDDQS